MSYRSYLGSDHLSPKRLLEEGLIGREDPKFKSSVKIDIPPTTAAQINAATKRQKERFEDLARSNAYIVAEAYIEALVNVKVLTAEEGAALLKRVV